MVTKELNILGELGGGFFAPKAVRCNQVELNDGVCTPLAAGGVIEIIFDNKCTSNKLIVNFTQTSQEASIEIECYSPDRSLPIGTLSVLDPCGMLIEYANACVNKVVIRFVETGPVKINAIGLAAVGNIEQLISRYPSMLRYAKKLKRMLDLSRKACRYVRQNGVDAELVAKVKGNLKGMQGGSGALKDPFKEVFAYSIEDALRLRFKNVAIGCSSSGNFFMNEIADLVSCGFQEAGLQVSLFDQKVLVDIGQFDAVIIVAPHEFFFLDCTSSSIKTLMGAKRLWMLNTEQPQTQWFAKALKYLSKAHLILDMNYQSAIRMRCNRLPAIFFPLGYAATYENKFQLRTLKRRGPLLGLPQHVLDEEPKIYAERPIDILFVGTASLRRKSFFVENATFFADRNCFIYIPEGTDPFAEDSPATIDFAQLIGLARRSKIVLNIHRDPDRYLEWQRIVNLGVLAGTVVVSETCESNPVLLPTKHYIDAPLEMIPEICTSILASTDYAAKFASSAQASLVKSIALKKYVRNLSRFMK